MNESLPNDFVEVCQSLDRLNLEIGSSGNISFRDKNGVVYITPSGSEFRDISKNNISIISEVDMHDSYDATKPSSDLLSHLAIYDERRDVNVILHTHAHPVVVAAMIGDSIPVLNTMHADYFGGPIECTPFSNHRKTGLGLARYFGAGSAFLLGKHGGLLFFSELDVKKITDTMRAFSEVCSLYYDITSITSRLSKNIEAIATSDLSHIHDYYQTQYGGKTRE